MESQWSKTVVFLANLPERGSRSREGYVDQDGVVALPPKAGHKISEWKRRMGIREGQ